LRITFIIWLVSKIEQGGVIESSLCLRQYIQKNFKQMQALIGKAAYPCSCLVQ